MISNSKPYKCFLVFFYFYLCLQIFRFIVGITLFNDFISSNMPRIVYYYFIMDNSFYTFYTFVFPKIVLFFSIIAMLITPRIKDKQTILTISNELRMILPMLTWLCSFKMLNFLIGIVNSIRYDDAWFLFSYSDNNIYFLVIKKFIFSVTGGILILYSLLIIFVGLKKKKT